MLEHALGLNMRFSHHFDNSIHLLMKSQVQIFLSLKRSINLKARLKFHPRCVFTLKVQSHRSERSLFHSHNKVNSNVFCLLPG